MKRNQPRNARIKKESQGAKKRKQRPTNPAQSPRQPQSPEADPGRWLWLKMKAILILPSQPPARAKQERCQKPLQNQTKGLPNVEELQRLSVTARLLLWQTQRKVRLLSQAPARPDPPRGERLWNLRSLLLELFRLTRPQRKTLTKAQQRQKKPARKLRPNPVQRRAKKLMRKLPPNPVATNPRRSLFTHVKNWPAKSQRFCQSAKGIGTNAKTIRKTSWLWLRTMTPVFRSLSTGTGLLLDWKFPWRCWQRTKERITAKKPCSKCATVGAGLATTPTWPSWMPGSFPEFQTLLPKSQRICSIHWLNHFILSATYTAISTWFAVFHPIFSFIPCISPLRRFTTQVEKLKEHSQDPLRPLDPAMKHFKKIGMASRSAALKQLKLWFDHLWVCELIKSTRKFKEDWTKCWSIKILWAPVQMAFPKCVCQHAASPNSSHVYIIDKINQSCFSIRKLFPFYRSENYSREIDWKNHLYIRRGKWWWHNPGIYVMLKWGKAQCHGYFRVAAQHVQVQ